MLKARSSAARIKEGTGNLLTRSKVQDLGFEGLGLLKAAGVWEPIRAYRGTVKGLRVFL